MQATKLLNTGTKIAYAEKAIHVLDKSLGVDFKMKAGDCIEMSVLGFGMLCHAAQAQHGTYDIVLDLTPKYPMISAAVRASLKL